MEQVFIEEKQQTQSAKGLDIHVIGNVISRRRWIFLAVSLLVFTGGLLFVAQQTRLYTASAVVLIEPNPPKVLQGVKDV